MMQKPVFKHSHFLPRYIIIILISVTIGNLTAHKQIKPVQAQAPIQQQNTPKLTLSDQELENLISQANVSKVAPPKINNQDIFLPPHTNSIDSSNDKIITNSITSLDRCMYNNQTYVLGDIVKTDQGWMRCTQTTNFADTSITPAQNGEAAWTKVQ